MLYFVFVFFFKQKTAYEMRISDWSSDVCSSDLGELGYLVLPMAAGFFLIAPLIAVGLYDTSRRLESGRPVDLGLALMAWHRPAQIAVFGMEIGRASCRERVCQYV